MMKHWNLKFWKMYFTDLNKIQEKSEQYKISTEISQTITMEKMKEREKRIMER